MRKEVMFKEEHFINAEVEDYKARMKDRELKHHHLVAYH
jgi:hypothetical protein